MRESTQIAIGLAAAGLLGTAYVLVHEKRRKLKAEKRRLAAAQGAHSGSGVLSRERLLALLDESATATYQLIEQTRKMVHVKHEQSGISMEEAVNELQKDFESALETVLGAIRMKHQVTERQMSQAMAADPNDEGIKAAVQILQDAMAGKPPPNYLQNVQEQTKKSPRRGKTRKKG
ncbi:hypothetical protein AB1Y20_010780 [Prymnesium parvum]|uniref:Peroxin-14 n=1 Tax=Prymnesium parvum TaxID=97485 RepID=A0AB34ISA7_PRYPA|mmetsp:Transcript_10364/g.25733  ORF Transcript_10364/g.25733 Transcript_10364/m.25733 type:complete len:176 (+) Transcript_10364:64-591(+)